MDFRRPSVGPFQYISGRLSWRGLSGHSPQGGGGSATPASEGGVEGRSPQRVCAMGTVGTPGRRRSHPRGGGSYLLTSVRIFLLDNAVIGGNRLATFSPDRSPHPRRLRRRIAAAALRLAPAGSRDRFESFR